MSSGISGIGGPASLALQMLVDMRGQLDELQRQLGTGKKSTSYAGLGVDRSLVVGLHSQLSAITGYQQTITQVGVRLDIMQTALSQFSEIAQDTKSTILQSQFVLHGDTATVDQKNTKSLLKQLVGLLNTGADGRYLFGGRAVDQVPVEDVDKLIDGTGLRAGLKQLIDERRQADLGASGLGRLTVGGTANSVSLTEDAAPPFGFKLAGATTSIAGATVTGPSAPPATLSVTLAGQPADGDTVRFSFTLPDGSTRDLTLTATTSATPAAGQFGIGGTVALTAGNLQTALGQALGTLASTELVAASAIAAGNDFFNTDASNPPQRVAGPPFDTATTMVNGTAADTVMWYLGDDAVDDPRTTAVARADQALSVSYGVRANEHAITTAVRSFAVFAAMSYSGSDPNAEGQYVALRQRIGAALVGTPNEQKLSDIQGQLAGAQVALNSSKDRHQQTNTTLQNLLQSVEGVSTEEVAAKILALQTSLQATLQTTAKLLQINLLQYL